MLIEGILVLALNFGGNNLLTNPFTSEYWQNLQNIIIKQTQQKPLVSPTPKPSVSSIVISLLSPSPKPTLIPTPTPKPTVKPTQKPSIKPKSTSSIKSTPKPVNNNSFSSQQVLDALNNYRASKGIAKLQFDQKLQTYAKTRSDYLKSRGSLDNHAQFNDLIQNQDGFGKLGFNALAENQSWNYKGTAEGLITEFYAKSPGHNANQLSGEYTHVGIGITGEYTNLVFGGRKR
jgi:uncharacterized protein YkwD